MKRTALIDFDALVYRCGFAAQHTEYYIYDKTAPEMGWIAMYKYKKEADAYVGGIDDYYIVPKLVVEPVGNAIHNIKASMQATMTNTRSDDYRGFLSGKENFREALATIRPYKGNRDPEAKPAHYMALRDYCLLQYNATIVDGQEADDALGIAQWNDLNLATEDHTTIICTIDKDLNNIPGWHYNFNSKEVYWVDEEEATYNFYHQLLTGDVTDNILGVPGIGPAKAKKILSPCTSEKDMYVTVWNVYRDAYPDVEDAEIDKIVLENARLLWIRRAEGEMWCPPSIFETKVSN